MNNPVREPHIAYGDPEAILEQIANLAWSIRVHAEVIERYASLGHLEGIKLAAKDARACLVNLIYLLEELPDAPG